MEKKVCTRCGEEKDLSMFTKRKNRPCGTVAMCKPCCSQYQMERRDKDQHAKDRAAHRKARPDLVRAASKRYWDKHPEYRKSSFARFQNWQKANPEKFEQAKKNWLAKNEGIQRYYTQNYRAKKRANGGELSHGLEKILMIEQGCKCPYCMSDLRTTGYDLDHYIPVDLGGPNENWNMQLTCPPCNKKKSNKHPLAFIGFEISDANLWKIDERGRDENMDRSDDRQQRLF